MRRARARVEREGRRASLLSGGRRVWVVKEEGVGRVVGVRGGGGLGGGGGGGGGVGGGGGGGGGWGLGLRWGGGRR